MGGVGARAGVSELGGYGRGLRSHAASAESRGAQKLCELLERASVERRALGVVRAEEDGEVVLVALVEPGREEQRRLIDGGGGNEFAPDEG